MSGEQASPKPIDLTRDELHRQVWATPMTKLAKTYGLSDSGLAKICRRLLVPFPPRGYWAKKAAGHKVRVTPLPKAQADTPSSAHITPSPPSEDRTARRMPLKAQTLDTSAPSFAVPAELRRPHAIVAKWIAEHHRRLREPKTRGPRPQPIAGAERRRHLLLDTLFKELERQGGKIIENERHQLFVELRAERIEFQLRYKQKQIKRPLTEDEKRWSWNANRDSAKELQPTDTLVFAIKTYLPDGLRTEWLEGDKATMEQMLPTIVAAIMAAGPALEERTRQRREAERQQQIAEHKRYEEQQRRKLERNRWRRFLSFATDWKEAELARAFLAALRTKQTAGAQIIGDKTLDEWVAWAEDRISSGDPMLGPIAPIFEEIAAVTSWSYKD